MNIFYFGCQDEIGHYWWTPKFDMVGCGFRDKPHKDCPWDAGEADGKLQPRSTQNWLVERKHQEEGEILLHQKEGWTAIAWWDRSVDRRLGSCSCFTMEGVFSFEEALAHAKENFPSIFERIKFELKELK